MGRRLKGQSLLSCLQNLSFREHLEEVRPTRKKVKYSDCDHSFTRSLLSHSGKDRAGIRDSLVCIDSERTVWPNISVRSLQEIHLA